MSALGPILAILGTFATIAAVFAGVFWLAELERRRAVRERFKETFGDGTDGDRFTVPGDLKFPVHGRSK